MVRRRAQAEPAAVREVVPAREVAPLAGPARFPAVEVGTGEWPARFGHQVAIGSAERDVNGQIARHRLERRPLRRLGRVGRRQPLGQELEGRLDAQAPPLREPVALLDLLEEEAARVGARVEGEPGEIVGEAGALRRMVRNLLENARRHSDDVAVRLEVAESGSPSAVRIVVDDRGPGVPEAERERIFEPFYRPAGHREGRDGGVGLGLSLVRRIAEAHGGRAYCGERPGGGGRFAVELPGD